MDAYLLYTFSDSVSEQYSAFSSGFLKVCGGEILSLFQPSELMAMVVGNNNYNWEEMEKVSVWRRVPPTGELFALGVFSVLPQELQTISCSGSDRPLSLLFKNRQIWSRGKEGSFKSSVTHLHAHISGRDDAHVLLEFDSPASDCSVVYVNTALNQLGNPQTHGATVESFQTNPKVEAQFQWMMVADLFSAPDVEL